MNMNINQSVLPIDQNAVALFFSEAWTALGWDGMPSIMGEQTSDGLLPPAFQFSDNREEATHIAHDVANGKKTSFSTPRRDFDDAGVALPAVGDLSIICDGEGKPVALIEDKTVDTSDDTVVEHFDCRYPKDLS